MTGNREYKSDVFSMLMEDRNNALQLYNAINGSDYVNPEAVEICNLDKGISLSVRNDAAFVLDMNLSVYEHQSTVCPNMPVRSLVYFSIMLKEMIRDRNIYGRTQVKIPTPRFYRNIQLKQSPHIPFLPPWLTLRSGTLIHPL